MAAAGKLNQSDRSDFRVTGEERELLESRMADLEKNPSAQEPWQKAKAALESRRH
jgi:hypothetical protein